MAKLQKTRISHLYLTNANTMSGIIALTYGGRILRRAHRVRRPSRALGGAVLKKMQKAEAKAKGKEKTLPSLLHTKILSTSWPNPLEPTATLPILG